MNKTTLTTTIGFILLMLGFLSLILKIVGVHLSFLFWLEDLGSLPATIVRLLMIFGGIIMIYMSRVDQDV